MGCIIITLNSHSLMPKWPVLPYFAGRISWWPGGFVDGGHSALLKPSRVPIISFQCCHKNSSPQPIQTMPTILITGIFAEFPSSPGQKAIAMPNSPHSSVSDIAKTRGKNGKKRTRKSAGPAPDGRADSRYNLAQIILKWQAGRWQQLVCEHHTEHADLRRFEL